MPLYRYDLAEANPDIFSRMVLPALQVGVCCNGLMVGSLDIRENGIAGLFLDSNLIDRIKAGEMMVRPLTKGVANAKSGEADLELVRLDLVNRDEI